MAEGSPHPPRALAPQTATLVALILGQMGLHSTMAGVRMAGPLQALRAGASPWAVGVLLSLFAAAAVVLAMHAGRMADRHGYHRPVALAAQLSIAGAVCALASTWFAFDVQFALLCVAAALGGAGANIGIIAIQRTAGRSATNSTERMRMFSWLGIAPALSNVFGAVSAGVLIDLWGFRAAFAFLLLLPLVTLAASRRVPREVLPPPAPPDPSRSMWDLWRLPGMRRLLFVNWLLSACWDVHTFAVPILGHERGFSASTIGLVLGMFPLAVGGVRVLIPVLAHRMDEIQVLRGAMIGTGAVFALYPFAYSPWVMSACAVMLGMTLGSVQPMILSTLHRLTPENRHGEALAWRSMTMNAASSAMPLLFGAAGSAVGASGLFWLMGAAVAAGSRSAKRLRT